MKQLHLFIICILLSFSLYAQDTTLIDTPPVGLAVPISHGTILSAQPAAQELADLFISACGGAMNPLDAVNLAVEKGDDAVAGLNELLFSETIHQSKQSMDNPETDTVIIYPNKLFTVLALDSIGTQNAMTALIRAADVHTDPEIRGLALNAVANQYCQLTDTSKAKRVKFQPDKTAIRLLVDNAGDSTYIGYLQKTKDWISREALVQLLGLDFDDPQFKVKRNPLIKTKNEFLTPAQYAQQWWKENEKNISWNKETRRFSIDSN
jgi:hypothetical protein